MEHKTKWQKFGSHTWCNKANTCPQVQIHHNQPPPAVCRRLKMTENPDDFFTSATVFAELIRPRRDVGNRCR